MRNPTYYSYDGAGRLSAIMNSLGETVYYGYDSISRQTLMPDPLGNATYYEYDAVGRQTAGIDAIGQEQSVVYDPAGRIVRLDKASGVGAYYEYDAVGRVLSELRYPSGNAIYYEYDATGAVTGVQKTGVEDQSWEYDAAGRVTHFAQGGNDLYYQYDAADRRSAMTQVVGEDLLTTYYEYRSCGKLNSITDPWGREVSYDYDDLGRQTAKVLPNGVTTYHNYDAASQVTQVAHLGPSGVLLSFDYTYDTDGRRTKIVREDGTSIYYGYDTVGRLTSEEWLDDSDAGIYSFAYEFDVAGNRSLLTKNGETTYYSYNTLNQLTLTESTEGALTYYTYQADGALEAKHDADGWAYYDWDVDEALLRVTRVGTTTGQATALYDAQMKRVARDLDGTATYYAFDGEKIARIEQPEAGYQDFYVQEGPSIYSPLVSVHDETADAQYWYLFDAMGSTMGLVDASGNLTGKLQYDAFGNVLEETNVPRSAFFKYVGAYQYMPEPFEGMMLLWHRWHEPGSGRFVAIAAGRAGDPDQQPYASHQSTTGATCGVTSCAYSAPPVPTAPAPGGSLYDEMRRIQEDPEGRGRGRATPPAVPTPPQPAKPRKAKRPNVIITWIKDQLRRLAVGVSSDPFSDYCEPQIGCGLAIAAAQARITALEMERDPDGLLPPDKQAEYDRAVRILQGACRFGQKE